MTIPFHSVIEGDRKRDLKKYGDISGLAKRISELGSINPIGLSRRRPMDEEVKLCDSEGYVYDLVHGGRRFRAMRQLKTTELHYASFLNPEKLGFLWSSEVPEHTLREAELDENLHRLDMDWVDIAMAISDLHTLKKKASIRWTQLDTTKLLGKDWGKSSVNNFIRVAKLLRAQDKEILACENMNEALKVIIKRNEDAALKELHRRTLPSSAGPSSTASFLDSLNISSGPTKTPTVPQPKPTPGVSSTPVEKTTEKGETPQAKPAETHDPVCIPLSKMFMCGDFRTVLPALPDSSFNHIVTDIPYGISMDNLDLQGLSDVIETHDVDQNVDQMHDFLKQAFRLTKPAGFCVFFYDLDHHEKLHSWAEEVGWRATAWPYIACKTSPCKNQSPQKNPTKNYEVCMFLRRDETTALRQPMPSSWKTYDFAIERKMYNNPFAKPFELWQDIYRAISFPGQSVLDPFCGEMSAGRAAANCGLVPFGVEISEKHFNRGMLHMQKVYALLHKSNCTFA